MTNNNAIKEYIIDGNEFQTLNQFADYFSKTILENHQWKGNLDAFKDILYGGFGTPENGFKIKWINAHKSKFNLGKNETIKWYNEALKTCHPSNQGRLKGNLEELEKGNGAILFDWIIEIIKNIKGNNEWDKHYKVELIIEY